MNPQTSQPPLFTIELTEQITIAGGLIAACQLGLFEALADGPRAIPEIADAVGGSEKGVACLVEALASVGYLKRVDDGYASGPMHRAFLTSASPDDLTSHLLVLAQAWQGLGELAQSIRRGGPGQDMWQFNEEHPEIGRAFARYMQTFAQLNAAPIAEAQNLPDGASSLLDLGGSHGLYSIAFCKRHPNLKAVVFDLPAALTETEDNIAAEGLSGRVSVRGGNYFIDDIGQEFDVILLFRLLHDHSEEENSHLLAKVAKALKPGGMVVLQSTLRKEPPEKFDAIFSLRLFARTENRCYTYEEIAVWLRNVGFDDFKRIDLPPPGRSSLISAVHMG